MAPGRFEQTEGIRLCSCGSDSSGGVCGVRGDIVRAFGNQICVLDNRDCDGVGQV
ncbi:hypothetical protein HK100_007097 [Physocladia obscura]|uniref:Uncharacterized protein n=1 Tax=Physocladia obscura TaxID=109957 RepID=A0AAD5SPM8_9FUNG|nr:hypothetical protein HK100_007097 [Physocladia obscura]